MGRIKMLAKKAKRATSRKRRVVAEVGKKAMKAAAVAGTIAAVNVVLRETLRRRKRGA